MRGFEKISAKQARADDVHESVYEAVELPTRATSKSAGYDIRSSIDIMIHPGQTVKIPTCIRAFMEPDEVCLIHVRSSLGFKYGLRLANSTGVIDSDYYDAANEGHIWVAIHNDSHQTYNIKVGERFAQAIFMKYLTTGDEVETQREGGMGSTGKEG